MSLSIFLSFKTPLALTDNFLSTKQTSILPRQLHPSRPLLLLYSLPHAHAPGARNFHLRRARRRNWRSNRQRCSHSLRPNQQRLQTPIRPLPTPRLHPLTTNLFHRLYISRNHLPQTLPEGKKHRHPTPSVGVFLAICFLGTNPRTQYIPCHRNISGVSRLYWLPRSIFLCIRRRSHDYQHPHVQRHAPNDVFTKLCQYLPCC